MKVYGFEEPSEVSNNFVMVRNVGEADVKKFDFDTGSKSEVYLVGVDGGRWFTDLSDCRKAFRKECDRRIKVYQNLKRDFRQLPIEVKD